MSKYVNERFTLLYTLCISVLAFIIFLSATVSYFSTFFELTSSNTAKTEAHAPIKEMDVATTKYQQQFQTKIVRQKQPYGAGESPSFSYGIIPNKTNLLNIYVVGLEYLPEDSFVWKVFYQNSSPRAPPVQLV